MYYEVFTNMQKKPFFEFQKVWNHTFFFCFFNFEDFSEKLRKKKHNFHFQIAKILNFVHRKKVCFSNFTLVHRHLPNSRETVSSFTAVSLKLTWNSKNGQSFSETGCQKYVVFGMKSAKSTVSRETLWNWRIFFCYFGSKMKLAVVSWVKLAKIMKLCF